MKIDRHCIHGALSPVQETAKEKNNYDASFKKNFIGV